MLLNPMIGGMMSQAKKVPVMLSVMSEKKPLGLLVIKDDEMDRLEELRQDSKYSEHSIDQPNQPEDEPKWAAFTYPLPPTLNDSFGINSQVRILEDQGYWVKVRPLTNTKGYCPSESQPGLLRRASHSERTSGCHRYSQHAHVRRGTSAYAR